jgi:hypothetical protein
MITYDPDLPWAEFAKQTVRTDDLDPVYVALSKSDIPEDMLMRWCTAFVTYYHMGIASQLCELTGDKFWEGLFNCYDTAPRAAERRHFRGQAGLKAMKRWVNEYKTPEKFFTACMQPSFMGLLKKNIPQIGTYFTWKCMDLREAVFGYAVDWKNSEKHMVELPKQGLNIIFPGVPSDIALLQVVNEIKWMKAPPRYTRDCGVAEAETIACMIKGYYKNGKAIGADIVDKRLALTGYGFVADEILKHMPEEPFDTEIIS